MKFYLTLPKTFCYLLLLGQLVLLAFLAAGSITALVALLPMTAIGGIWVFFTLISAFDWMK